MNNTVDPSENRCVYHYCSLDSALKILESSKLWLTHISYLNDSKELIGGINYLMEQLNLRLASSKRDRIQELVLEKLSKPFDWSYFVACFCESGDKLSQWRAYADDGRGVAIGFRRDEFSGNVDSPFDVRLQEVQYDDKSLQATLDILLNKFAESRHNFDDNQSLDSKELQFNQTANHIVSWLIDSAVFRKDIGFSEEQECRYVYIYTMGEPTQSDLQAETNGTLDNVVTQTFRELKSTFLERVKVRVGRHGITPYVEVPFASQKSIIGEIVLGPKVHTDMAQTALNRFREANKYNFSIDKSKIPYR